MILLLKKLKAIFPNEERLFLNSQPITTIVLTPFIGLQFSLSDEKDINISRYRVM